jgi:hypothetical protein
VGAVSAARRCNDIVRSGQVPDAETQIAAIDEWLSAWVGHPKLPIVDQLLEQRSELMVKVQERA